MDFSFTEEQETVGKVARQLFEHRATPEHLTELEAGEMRYDGPLWRELATSDLLGIALPDSVGGSGGGFLELGVLLTEVGWSVAPVPVYATLVLGADTIARHGDSDIQQRYLPGVADGSILLEGVCPIEDAEPLLRLLSSYQRTTVDWRACERAHSAVVQVLLAAGPKMVGPPGDKFLRDRVESLIGVAIRET